MKPKNRKKIASSSRFQVTCIFSHTRAVKTCSTFRFNIIQKLDIERASDCGLIFAVRYAVAKVHLGEIEKKCRISTEPWQGRAAVDKRNVGINYH